MRRVEPRAFWQIATVAVTLLALIGGRSLAETGTFEAANQAYDQGKFAEAKIGYEKLVEAGEWSANLFYNLGNADYRAGAPGRAILDYERALALDPAHAEARANVEVLRRQTGAKHRAAVWQDKAFGWPAADAWTLIAAAAGWIALFGLALLGTARRGENGGLWLTSTLGALVCAYAAAVLWWHSQESTAAIVVHSTEARLQPADSAGLAEALPAGSRVQVLSERGDWIYCALPGEKRGWIPHPAIERVRLEKT
ncbi:MAG: tetratricopeptide repeat protein [Chthoniobacter sp.]|nr:tetratricopeptide repeat protein [Chthoniobacter sp.]